MLSLTAKRNVISTLAVLFIASASSGSAMADRAAGISGATQYIRDFEKLGNGGCRTADGKHGRFYSVKNVSLGRCKDYCIEGGAKCKGLEYNRTTRHCELHLITPKRVNPGRSAECYRSIMATTCPKCD
jgi:hypothetical protein